MFLSEIKKIQSRTNPFYGKPLSYTDAHAVVSQMMTEERAEELLRECVNHNVDVELSYSEETYRVEGYWDADAGAWVTQKSGLCFHFLTKIENRDKISEIVHGYSDQTIMELRVWISWGPDREWNYDFQESKGALKKAKFRWHPELKCWYKRFRKSNQRYALWGVNLAGQKFAGSIGFDRKELVSLK